jgi:hypothetical protein
MLIRDLPEPPNETRLLIMDNAGGATYVWRNDHLAQGSIERWFRPAPLPQSPPVATWEEITRNAISIWGISSAPIAIRK